LNRLICAREYKLSARFGTLKNHNNINNFYNANIMNSNINNILIGCLLGDAHIEICSDDKAFITFEQTIKHKDYIIFIYQNLKDNGINLYDIKYYTRKDYRYNSINNSIYFKTYNLELLKPLANMFFTENNYKIIPLDIECHLNPISLAYWICVDGQLVKNGGITLCTNNYTLIEVELLIKALINKFNMKCTIHNKKSKTDRIYIFKSSLNNIKPLIIPHIHKSFLYKIHF